jgi:hypothetical protein
MKNRMNIMNKTTLKQVVITLTLVISLLASCATLTFPTTVCHATDDPANPYSGITVNSAEELLAHREHTNDIFPMPAGGCPTIPVETNNGKITICHATGSDSNPYNEITISVDGLNGHATHEGDIIPMPEGGCPPAPVEVNDGKITICHATGSAKNPYNEITISINGLNGHGKHENDIIPMPAEGCPTTLVNVKTNKGQEKKSD